MRILLAVCVLVFCSWANSAKTTHKCKTMKSAGLERLESAYDENYLRNTLLRPFMRVRVSDTPGNTAVQNHIKNSLNLQGWTIEEDKFEDETPFGRKNFTNIIAKSHAQAGRWLTLACHFDSKYFANIEFLGATDSAVPCAILLYVARKLNTHLQSLKEPERPGDEICYCQCCVEDGVPNTGLQLIFFDGEEAFVQWTQTDSLYGSRHLAQLMESSITRIGHDNDVRQLELMDLMILLDLIGAGGSTFRNWFPNKSGPAFERMMNIEGRLRTKGFLREHHTYFSSTPTHGSGGIEDDHVPFQQRGVSVLHMIAYPFPSVWHTRRDNWDAIRYSEVHDITLLVQVFACEWIHLPC